MGTESYYCMMKCKPCDYETHVPGAFAPDCEKCLQEPLWWTEEQRLGLQGSGTEAAKKKQKDGV